MQLLRPFGQLLPQECHALPLIPYFALKALHRAHFLGSPLDQTDVLVIDFVLAMQGYHLVVAEAGPDHRMVVGLWHDDRRVVLRDLPAHNFTVIVSISQRNGLSCLLLRFRLSGSFSIIGTLFFGLHYRQLFRVELWFILHLSIFRSWLVFDIDFNFA